MHFDNQGDRMPINTKYSTLLKLKNAYESGELSKEDNPLVIDNDICAVYDGEETIFRSGNSNLLEDALDLLGIKHEPA
jgi:hypothetical protein